MRELFDGEQLPAIALTAFVRSEDRREALRQGFQLHVPKPIDPFELTQAVAKLVGRSPAQSTANSPSDKQAP